MREKIKHVLDKIISVLPGGKRFLKKREHRRKKQRMTQLGGTREVFDHIYKVNLWGSEESVSGPGSTLEYTASIRQAIPELVHDRGISVILDAPCGDYNWFQMIEWKQPITYVGGDIVPDLITQNQSLHGNGNTRFMTLDITRDDLPAADLWLCRDCLFHLPYRDIFLAVENFLTSDIRYLLTSMHPQCRKNRDVYTGAFRMLNLQLKPFTSVRRS